MTPVTSGRWLATSSFPPFNPKPRFGSGTDASAEAANLCYFLHVYVSDIQGQFEFFYPYLFPALLSPIKSSPFLKFWLLFEASGSRLSALAGSTLFGLNLCLTVSS